MWYDVLLLILSYTPFYPILHYTGSVSPEVRDLVVTTYQAWKAAIAICRPGVKYNEIGGVIEEVVRGKGYTSVKEFCGHGSVIMSILVMMYYWCLSYHTFILYLSLMYTADSLYLYSIGRVFHTTPNVLHYTNYQRSGVMAPGHCFTIEPMICMGSNVPVIWPDAWTAATADGKPTAQFEHTLLITENGVEELTGKLETSPKYSWEV